MINCMCRLNFHDNIFVQFLQLKWVSGYMCWDCPKREKNRNIAI